MGLAQPAAAELLFAVDEHMLILALDDVTPDRQDPLDEADSSV